MKSNDYLLRKELIIETKDDELIRHLNPRLQKVFTSCRLEVRDVEQYTPEQLSRAGRTTSLTIKKMAEEFGDDPRRIEEDLARAEARLVELGCNFNNLSGFRLVERSPDFTMTFDLDSPEASPKINHTDCWDFLDGYISEENYDKSIRWLTNQLHDGIKVYKRENETWLIDLSEETIDYINASIKPGEENNTIQWFMDKMRKNST